MYLTAQQESLLITVITGHPESQIIFNNTHIQNHLAWKNQQKKIDKRKVRKMHFRMHHTFNNKLTSVCLIIFFHRKQCYKKNYICSTSQPKLPGCIDKMDRYRRAGFWSESEKTLSTFTFKEISFFEWEATENRNFTRAYFCLGNGILNEELEYKSAFWEFVRYRTTLIYTFRKMRRRELIVWKGDMAWFLDSVTRDDKLVVKKRQLFWGERNLMANFSNKRKKIVSMNKTFCMARIFLKRNHNNQRKYNKNVKGKFNELNRVCI